MISFVQPVPMFVPAVNTASGRAQAKNTVCMVIPKRENHNILEAVQGTRSLYGKVAQLQNSYMLAKAHIAITSATIEAKYSCWQVSYFKSSNSRT
jgi:hypothetical protein